MPTWAELEEIMIRKGVCLDGLYATKKRISREAVLADRDPGEQIAILLPGIGFTHQGADQGNG